MVTISKKLSLSIFFALILFSIYFMVQVISNYNSGSIIFKYIRLVFLITSISIIFLKSYTSKVSIKPSKNLKKLAYVTFSILILETLIFSVFILKLIELGFLSDVELYWQIVSFVLFGFSLLALVYIHKKDIMEKI